LFVLLGLENRFVFAPTRAIQDWQPPPADLHIQDVELTSSDSTRIHAWWMTPHDWQQADGALLYSHGNAGNLSHRGDGLRRWRDQMHLAVLIFDYPGYGRSSGRPTEAGCYAAADAAYDFLTDTAKVPGDRIMLYGGSLGGAVATDLATRRPHRALVLVSVFSSLADMARLVVPWLAAGWFIRRRFNNLAKLPACHQPVFIAHGTADRVVPFSQGERLFAVANEPKMFFPMAGYDHNHTPPLAFYEALRQFLARPEAMHDLTAGKIKRI
jgi:fermentation-respiration switch protein FrsA (DUF1100 family)